MFSWVIFCGWKFVYVKYKERFSKKTDWNAGIVKIKSHHQLLHHSDPSHSSSPHILSILPPGIRQNFTPYRHHTSMATESEEQASDLNSLWIISNMVPEGKYFSWNSNASLIQSHGVIFGNSIFLNQAFILLLGKWGTCVTSVVFRLTPHYCGQRLAWVSDLYKPQVLMSEKGRKNSDFFTEFWITLIHEDNLSSNISQK